MKPYQASRGPQPHHAPKPGITGKTKKYQLQVKTFTNIGMRLVLKEFWYAFLVPVAMILIGAFFPSSLIWVAPLALVVAGLWVGFWYIQFYSVDKVPQGKVLFEKLFYEFDNKQLMLKKTDFEGMAIPWTSVTGILKEKEGYVIRLGRVQFLYIPYNIFLSERDQQFAEAVLRRNNLLPTIKTAAPEVKA